MVTVGYSTHLRVLFEVLSRQCSDESSEGRLLKLCQIKRKEKSPIFASKRGGFSDEAPIF